MLGNDLQVVPGSFAAPLHLGQIVLQLVKVHLRKAFLKKQQPNHNKCHAYFMCHGHLSTVHVLLAINLYTTTERLCCIVNIIVIMIK